MAPPSSSPVARTYSSVFNVADKFHFSFGTTHAPLFHLAYGDQGHLPTIFVVASAGRARIEDLFSVHQKSVLMVAMCQLHFDKPPAIYPRLHGVGGWLP